MKLKDVLADALPVIAHYAPTLAAAFSNPLGTACGYVVPLLASAFGSGTSNLSGLVKNILNDPKAESKLAQLETDHKDILNQLMQDVNDLTSAEISIKLNWNTK